MITTPIVLSSMADLIPEGTALPIIPKSVHLRGQKPLKLPLQAGKWWSLPPCSLVSGFKDVHFQHFSTHRNGTMIPTIFFSSLNLGLEAKVQLQLWIAHGPKGLLPCRKFKFWHLNGMVQINYGWCQPEILKMTSGLFEFWKYEYFSFS